MSMKGWFTMSNLQKEIYTYFQEHIQFHYNTNSAQKIREIDAIRELERNKYIVVTARYIDSVFAKVL